MMNENTCIHSVNLYLGLKTGIDFGRPPDEECYTCAGKSFRCIYYFEFNWQSRKRNDPEFEEPYF